MTFSLLELSKFGGKPVGFLRLARGSTLELYTNANRPITVGSETYQPLAIERSALRDSSEIRKNIVTITMPVDAPCASWWRPYPPGRRVDAVWLSMHWGDDEMVVEWIGRVIQPKYFDDKLELSCEPSTSNGRSRGRVLRWQRSCPHAVYDDLCGVDRNLHALPATLTSVVGITLQAAEFATLPDGRLAGGYVTWTRPDGETDFRTIATHVGNAVTMNYGDDTLAVGSAVTAFPGCKHNMQDCDGYFGNALNYGGSKDMPIRSPFDGNPV